MLADVSDDVTLTTVVLPVVVFIGRAAVVNVKLLRTPVTRWSVVIDVILASSTASTLIP